MKSLLKIAVFLLLTVPMQTCCQMVNIDCNVTDVFFILGQSNASSSGAFVSDLPSGEIYTRKDRYIYSVNCLQLLPYNPATNCFNFQTRFSVELSMSSCVDSRRTVYIKYYEGGVGIYQDPLQQDFNINSTGEAYDAAIAHYDAAIQDIRDQFGGTIRTRGYIFIHGEADGNNLASALAYETNVRDMEADLRSRYDFGGNPPFVYTEVSPLNTSPFAPDIRTAQQNAADASENGIFHPTAGLTLADIVHYDSPSMIQLGADLCQYFNY